MVGENKSGEKLANQIACIKYTLFCFNIVTWLLGAGLFGLTVWIRAEPGFEEWVSVLDIWEYYIGVYVLIALSVIVMVVSFLGCGSALMEHTMALGVFIITQIVAFIIGLLGSAVLLMFSTRDSLIQPLIHRTMTRLIMTSEFPPSTEILKMIQENIGCCGADGPNDYMLLRQPLPLECRDTVSGNAFSNGCVRELTWFLEDKSVWAVGIAMSLVMLHTINAVLSTVLIQALRKEEEEARIYRN